ncbi:CvfD/Ygs/GSP13 family RNA-binding post-transcriptional regulator [Lactobacillus sp. PV012]|uniref:CvfD/Ygs/GSP13 family RNA-binding post-transcriptional regulator n=1 Tax=Lactobacillus sp. PV012 TaxID=2594494 RepID=UPI00223FD2CC|nr:CvfD/Ygs/GSP13 family RNA-binding post-transcriptional regulator [Lactobacillus sp. PV012]QNQ81933.1 S1 RNA-binding domain-containing protein [Lactobacillus sp. PV012]
MKKVEIGEVVEGKISGIQQYGAFVRLENGEEGLIHVSEVREGYIAKIGEEFSVGQLVKVKVIDIDPYNGQISLSTRALQPSKMRRERRHFWTSKSVKIGFKGCEEELKKEIEKRVAKSKRIG